MNSGQTPQGSLWVLCSALFSPHLLLLNDDQHQHLGIWICFPLSYEQQAVASLISFVMSYLKIDTQTLCSHFLNSWSLLSSSNFCPSHILQIAANEYRVPSLPLSNHHLEATSTSSQWQSKNCGFVVQARLMIVAYLRLMIGRPGYHVLQRLYVIGGIPMGEQASHAPFLATSTGYISSADVRK